MKKSDFIEKYGEAAWEEHLRKNREWKKNNIEKNRVYYKKWKDENPNYTKEWRDKNPDYYKEWFQNHKDSTRIKQNDYNKTKQGRSNYLLSGYRKQDKELNIACTITQRWILDNIFNSSCVYCGESDWRKLGCDRIDNTKAHTPDNVVCACCSCNVKRNITPFRDFLLSQNPSGASEILSSLGWLQ